MKRKTKMIWIIVLAALAVLVCIGVWFVRSPYFTRVTFGISDTLRDRGLTTPEDIVRVDDQPYGEDPMQVYDVYYPAGTTGALPTIVNIHGGGYTYGSKEVYQYYCMNLAQRGFTVMSFSYRLAPEHKYPAPIEDANAALKHALARAEELHIDPNNVFFVGDSAGGHLNAQYTTAVTNPAYAKVLGLVIPAFTLRAVALNCGIYRADEASAAMGRYFLASPDDLQSLDFLPYITEQYPPAFVMSATGDMCLPYAKPMADFLSERGVENELHIYGTDTDKQPHVFHVNIRNDWATMCNDEECAFFAAHIGQPAK